METIDCRGMACPLPVTRVRDRMAAVPGVAFIVLVDGATAEENISRFVSSQGGTVTATKEGAHLRLQVTPAGAPGVEARPEAGPGGVVVLAARDRFGEGDPELGTLLIKGFFHTLLEGPVPPRAVICINRGVFLSSSPGQVADDLKALEGRGVLVLSCGTCLAHYGLRDSLAAGKVSNMYEIAETLLSAASVVPL